MLASRVFYRKTADQLHANGAFVTRYGDVRAQIGRQVGEAAQRVQAMNATFPPRGPALGAVPVHRGFRWSSLLLAVAMAC